MKIDGTQTTWHRAGRVARGASLLLAAVVLGLAGCQDNSAGSGGSAQGDANATLSPSDVLKANRQHLAIIETTWEESASALGGWKRQGAMNPGVFVASDGQQALVLTSRRAVDPRFGREEVRTRNSMFRVSTPGQRTAGQTAHARLVAVFMNNEDLALLRVSAPRPEAFAVGLGQFADLRAGQKVTIVGLPTGQGFALSEAIISNLWQDGQTGGKTLQLTLADGSPAPAGAVFNNVGGRLVGMIRGQGDSPAGPAVGFAVPADYLSDERYWDYLMEETVTRRLLSALR